jgi:hypothetical protein
MVVWGQWLTMGVVGTGSLVAAVAALPPPPPPERAPAPVVAAAAPEAGPCADEVWPAVSAACAGVVRPNRPVRYVSLAPVPAGTVPAGSLPVVAAPSARVAAVAPPAPTPTPVAAPAAARRSEARTAKRHTGPVKVREARRAPVVRVSLAPSQGASAPPSYAAYSYSVGPRPDR